MDTDQQTTARRVGRDPRSLGSEQPRAASGGRPIDPSNREQNSTPIYCSTCGSTVYLKHAVGCTDWQIPVLPTPKPKEGSRVTNTDER